MDARLSVIERYNAAWIDTAHGDDSEEKVLYLTFDFGYENGNTERIVNTLRDKGVKASFFLLSAPIEKNTELVCRLFAEGHAVCNHTQHHRDMSKCCDKVEFTRELSGREELCKLKTGYDMDKFYRPPEGKFTEENLRFATELGYKTVFWSFAYADWDNNAQPDPQKAKKLNLRLESIYWGGGTPTTLSAEQIEKICAVIEKNFDLSHLREYTVEAGRPDTVTAEKLAALKAAGITRLSINPQTFNDSV